MRPRPPPDSGRGVTYTSGISETIARPTDVRAIAPARRKRRPGWILRLIGKILLTAAFIVGAYILWLLWGTGFYYDRQQDRLFEQFEATVDGGDPDFRPGLDPPPDPDIDAGEAYAILRIPSIGVNEVVIQGVAVEDLKAGPGHYPRTADPWDTEGRVGIAGHRTTYGAPFWDLDKVRPGDEIRLVTEQGPYRYEVTESRDVPPTEASVLREAEQASLVLTTCTPRFSAALRLIVFADRMDEEP
jgi:sortase A